MVDRILVSVRLSLIKNVVGHLFTYLLIIWLSSSKKFLFKSLNIKKMSCFSFLILILGAINIFKMRVLVRYMSCNYLSQEKF